jgi:hypothetical protein
MDEAVSKALEQATTLVSQAANKMAELAPGVWDMLVWQARAEAIAGVLFAMGVVGVFVWLRATLQKAWPTPEWKETAYHYDANDAWVANLLITKIAPNIVITLTSLALLSDIYTGILKLLNPGYYAIKFLISMGGK